MIWRARFDTKKGLFHVYRDKPFAKDEIWFDVSIAEIDRMLKLYANSNFVFLSLVRKKGTEAIERWIENSSTDFIKRKRRELWDGDIYGEDQAISVIKKNVHKTHRQTTNIYLRTAYCKGQVMKKHTITQTDKAAYTLFTDALPYYWSTWESLPAGLRFHLSINGYGSAAMACVDIANHRISNPGLARDARKRLFHMQAWKGNEP